MTFATGAFSDAECFDRPLVDHGNSRRIILGAVVIGFGTLAAAWVIAALAAAWVIAASFTASPTLDDRARVAPKTPELANPYGTLDGAADFLSPALVLRGTTSHLLFDGKPLLFDPNPPVDANRPVDAKPPAAADIPAPAAPPPSTAASNPAVGAAAPADPAASIAPLPPRRTSELEKSVPLPPPHPVFRPDVQTRRGTRSDSQVRPQVRAGESSVAAAPARDDRNPFQKLFDALTQPASPGVANARPEDGGVRSAPTYNGAVSLPASDVRTAVYDISSHTVYMPNGERLEAHSGMANRIDDPGHVNERDRGATPPHVYDLVMREQLFHGVQALRLNPVGGGGVYGRTGLLAHTYMLGPSGQSNGCVSFKDYGKFLQAFSRGEVQRLVVVAHLGAAPSPHGAHGFQFASNP